jgi:hypothetical protein
VVEHLRDTDTRNVKQISTIFQGLEFMVSAVERSPQFGSKVELEIEIVRHGGTKVANQSSATRYIVAGDKPVGRAATYIKGVLTNHSGMVQRRRIGVKDKKAVYSETDYRGIDVVHSQWLADCIGQHALLPLKPRYLLHTCTDTAHNLSEFYDQFG